MNLQYIGKILSEKEENLFFKEIVKRLIAIRKSLNLTQQAFSEPAGIDRRYCGKIECLNQNPSFGFLRRICLYYGISFNYLCFGIGEVYIKDVKIQKDDISEIYEKYQYVLFHGSQEDIDLIHSFINSIIKKKKRK